MTGKRDPFEKEQAEGASDIVERELKRKGLDRDRSGEGPEKQPGDSAAKQEQRRGDAPPSPRQR